MWGEGEGWFVLSLLINHKVTFLKESCPKNFHQKTRQDIQAIPISKIEINSSKSHTFLSLNCSMEHVFHFGPEEMFLGQLFLRRCWARSLLWSQGKLQFLNTFKQILLADIHIWMYHTYITHTELQEDIWNRVPFCIYFTITMGRNKLTELIN